jgi:hypothetical protein
MVMSLRGSNSKLSGKLVSYAVICAMPYSQNLLSFVFMYICVFLLYFVQYPDRLFACLISLTTSFVKDIGRGTHILCFSERPFVVSWSNISQQNVDTQLYNKEDMSTITRNVIN